MAKKKSKVKKTQIEVREEPQKDDNFLDKISSDFQQKNSYLNLILGALIVIVVGILLFNYFNKPNEDLGPSQQNENQDETGDVAKENLPGQYTVKEGDTLFIIAQKYYDNGDFYTEIVRENNLANENSITTGQVLQIPKLNQPSTTPEASPSASPATTPSPSPSPQAAVSSSPQAQASPVSGATGGAENQTTWGEKITGNSYTVQDGDWLSKIAGRAYGDVLAYQRIAEANNITNPDLIEVGMTLKIPR